MDSCLQPAPAQPSGLTMNQKCKRQGPHLTTFLFFARGLFLAALFSMFFLLGGNADASQGTELAKAMLQKIGTVSTKNDLNTFLQKAAQEKSRLSTENRVDFVEYIYSAMVSDTNEGESSIIVGALMAAGTSKQEIHAGVARLLSSNNPIVRRSCEHDLTQAPVTLPNGELGQDMSVFDLALHDPKVPRDRLIGMMFKVAPVETTQWLTDHNRLSANERAGLESDLRKAWKMHRAVTDPSADNETKAALDDSVKNPQLDHWLHSPSWILRSLANGLLQKHPEWQTPELKKAMQPVQVPEGLQLSSTKAESVSK